MPRHKKADDPDYEQGSKTLGTKEMLKMMKVYPGGFDVSAKYAKKLNDDISDPDDTFTIDEEADSCSINDENDTLAMPGAPHGDAPVKVRPFYCKLRKF